MIVLKIALFLLMAAVLYYFQMVVLLRDGEKKDAVIYTGLMLAAAVLGALLIAGVQVPSPAVPLQAVFEPVGKWFFPEK